MNEERSEQPTASGASTDAVTNLYTSSLLGRYRKIIRERGLLFFLRSVWTVTGRLLYAWTGLRYRRQRSFLFRGFPYPYFSHRYNFAWDNERTVEVPIILRLLEEYRGKRILEVGNVLSHYLTPTWDVVDKFERAEGVLCADAVTFRPEEPYDLIIAISTLEHVGFDDTLRDPELAARAVANLRDHGLKPGGQLVVTVPVGYNPSLDEDLFQGRMGFTGTHFLLRTARYEWREAEAAEVRGKGYGHSYLEAEAVVIAELVLSPEDHGSPSTPGSLG